MFKLKFKTGNAAFMTEDGEEDQMLECEESARILKDIAFKLEQGYRNGLIMDFNGNHIGEFEFR